MSYIFGFKLGEILTDEGGGYNPNSTETETNPKAFILGDNITLFTELNTGSVLKNRRGDTWVCGDTWNFNTSIQFTTAKLTITDGINAGTYDIPFKQTSSTPERIYIANKSDDRFLPGSYVFFCKAREDRGGYNLGHPTRVDSLGAYISTGDSSSYVHIKTDGSIDDGKWSGVPSITYAFNYFLARELTLGEKDTNPYGPGGYTGPDGGGGDFNNDNVPIDFPSLPTISASDTGFLTIYNPTLEQLLSLSSYLWSDLFDINTFKRLFADPMDAILGLSIVPVSVPNKGSFLLKIGNVTTDISMNRAAYQFVTVDCGAITVNEYWGAYLDYDPFTKAEIYLPYIGIHPLSIDDIMGKTIHVLYHVDILSGACSALIKCGESVLYSFVGQCSCSIPITGNDWTSVINGAISIATSIGTMVATGGASAPMAVADIASAAVNSLKPNIEKSGAMGSMGGMLGVQTPYLILTRPRQAVPERQNMFTGYPSFVTRPLGELKGYTEIESIHLENVPATEQELSEIESLLKGGVLL